MKVLGGTLWPSDINILNGYYYYYLRRDATVNLCCWFEIIRNGSSIIRVCNAISRLKLVIV